jgi:hypothetical protein
MKIKRILTLLVVSGIIVLVQSCSKPDQHLNTIPSDAAVVGSADLFSLAKKAELYDMDQYAMYKKMMDQLKSEDEEIYNFVKDLMDNPLKTGLKYREDIYFFVKGMDRAPTMGVTMSMRNADDFKAFVNEILTKSKAPVKLEEQDGLSYISQGEAVLIFDDAKMLFLVKEDGNAEDALNKAKELMTQSEEKSIKSLPSFTTFKSNSQDMNIYLAMSNFPKTPQSAMIFSQLPFSLENNFSMFHFSFEDDGIYGTTVAIHNDEIKKMLEDYKFMKPELDDKLLSYLPKENYMSFGLALNPAEIYKFIYDIPSYKPMLDQANQGSPLSIEKFVNSLGGDVLIAMHGFNIPKVDETESYGNNVNMMPYATAILSMKDAEMYKQITTTMIPPGLFTEKDGVYNGNFQGINVYFGLFDNNLIVSNDQSIIDAAKNGGMAENVGDTELASLYKHSSFFYMNLDWEQYPEGLKDMLSKNMGNNELEMFQSVTNVLKEAKAYSNSATESKFEFVMRNTDGNSLHTILQMVDEFSSKN